MVQIEYTPAEVGRIGSAIYERDIRQKVEADNIGRLITIDILTGDYEIDDDGLQSAKRCRARHPDGQFLTLRIGYNAVGAIGGTIRRVEPWPSVKLEQPYERECHDSRIGRKGA